MNTNSNTDSAAYTRLLDDLRWLHARKCASDGPTKAACLMLADYTDDPDRYSDGSPVKEEFDPAEDDPSLYFLASDFRPLAPPHRRIL